MSALVTKKVCRNSPCIYQNAEVSTEREECLACGRRLSTTEDPFGVFDDVFDAMFGGRP